MTYVVQEPWGNADLENIWNAINGITFDTSGLALETTLVQVRNNVDDGNDLLQLINENLVDELDAANDNLVQIYDLLGTQLDITLTAQANLVKGGSTINDAVSWLQGNYSGINALSTRVIGANCTSDSKQNAVKATCISQTNTAVQGSGGHLLGAIQYEFDGLLWHSFYTLSTS